MHNFLVELIKYNSSLVVVNPITQAQLLISTDPIPMQEAEFKNFFSISTDNKATMKQQRVVIGCQMLGERMIKEIKFDTNKLQFMKWLDTHKIYIESDSLGMTTTTTIGHLTKIHPHLTNRTNLKRLLLVTLEDIVIDATLAIDLDNSLKAMQEDVMTNGDLFIPEVPPSNFIKHASAQDETRRKSKPT